MDPTTDNTCVRSSTPALVAGRFGPFVLPLVAAFVVLAVYVHAFTLGFVDWDDGVNFTDNRFLNAFTVHHALWLWRHPYAGVYSPVSYSVFGLLTLVARGPDGALDPHVFHAFNAIMHAFNAVLVYALLVKIVKNAPAAFGGALLFGLHPIQVETVAWASDLVRVLSAFFSLLSLLFYVRYAEVGSKEGALRRWEWAAAAVVCGILSILSKPGVITLPLIAFAIDVWLLNRPWKKCAPFLVAWLLVSLPFIGIALATEPPDHVAPLWSRPLIMLDALAFYIGKLAWPWPLCVDYGRTPNLVMHSSWRYYTWLLPSGIALAVLRYSKIYPWLLGGVLVSLFAVLPVSGLIAFINQDYSTVTDRYAYVAVLGVAIIAAQCLSRIPARGICVICALVIAIYGTITTIQLTSWDDSLSLYCKALAVAPEDFNSHFMLGRALMNSGKLSEAQEQFDRADAIKPGSVEVLGGRAELMFRLNQYSDAISLYRLATQVRKPSPIAFHALGMLLIQTGRRQEGLSYFRSALLLGPTDPVEHINLATALAKCGRLQEALQEYLIAERLDPDYRPTRINLSVLYGALGRVADVVSESRALIRLDNTDEVAHVNLGEALLTEGDARRAASEFRTALTLIPSDLSARQGLADALRTGD